MTRRQAAGRWIFLPVARPRWLRWPMLRAHLHLRGASVRSRYVVWAFPKWRGQ